MRGQRSSAGGSRVSGTASAPRMVQARRVGKLSAERRRSACSGEIWPGQRAPRSASNTVGVSPFGIERRRGSSVVDRGDEAIASTEAASGARRAQRPAALGDRTDGRQTQTLGRDDFPDDSRAAGADVRLDRRERRDALHRRPLHHAEEEVKVHTTEGNDLSVICPTPAVATAPIEHELEQARDTLRRAQVAGGRWTFCDRGGVCLSALRSIETEGARLPVRAMRGDGVEDSLGRWMGDDDAPGVRHRAVRQPTEAVSGPRSCARLTELVVINNAPLGSADLAVVEDAIRGQLRELGFRFDPDAVESLRLSINGKPDRAGSPCLEVTGELVRREAPYLPALLLTSMKCESDLRGWRRDWDRRWVRDRRGRPGHGRVRPARLVHSEGR